MNSILVNKEKKKTDNGTWSQKKKNEETKDAHENLLYG